MGRLDKMALSFLFAVLIALGALAVISTENRRNAPQRPFYAQISSTIYIVSYEKSVSIEGQISWKLDYAINGTSQSVFFANEKEVGIYLAYLNTLGVVNFGPNIELSSKFIDGRIGK